MYVCTYVHTYIHTYMQYYIYMCCVHHWLVFDRREEKNKQKKNEKFDETAKEEECEIVE